MASLVIAPSAENDLNSIVDYITLELCNPEAASCLLDKVEKAYDTLESLPKAFPFCDDEYLRTKGYRQVLLGNYLMIYRVEDGDEIVRILHFYHYTQDYLAKVAVKA